MFGKKKKSPSSDKPDYETTLDQKLYDVPGTDQEITWADAVEGTIIFGATGSGKTSGPGKHIALSVLEAGWPCFVLCAKSDEEDRWLEYAEKANRLDDVVILSEESDLKFGFLSYELTRLGRGVGEVTNIVEIIMQLRLQRKTFSSGVGQGNEDIFWHEALERLTSRTINTLILADEEVTITNMRRLVASCLREGEPEKYFDYQHQSTTSQKIDPEKRETARQKLEMWTRVSYCLQLLEKISNKHFDDSEELDQVNMTKDYWLSDLPGLGEKTTGAILESFFGVIEPFMNKGILKSQFSGGLSEELIPENIIRDKRIVIVNYPIKEYGLAGIYASIIYKNSFMAALERRQIKKEADPKPFCLWVDEYHYYVNPKLDPKFQTTARSSWVATVYITQNLNNLLYVMGNHQPEQGTKSLLGNLNLKYFACNADWETNFYASQMIGQHLTYFDNLSVSENVQTLGTQYSKSKNEHLHFRLTPDHFTILKTGREANNYTVEAVVFKAGKVWEGNQNYAIAEFNQKT